MSKKDKANKMEKVKLQSKWKKAAVGDVAEVFRGNTLLKSHLDKEGKYKCILYGELYTKYSEVISTVQSHTNLKKGISSKTGDVLLPGSTTTIALDLANATALLEDDVLLGADVNIIRSKNLIEYDPVFLAFYLTHIKKKEIAIYAQGITIVHLYAKDIKKVVLIFPPLSDQKKIVAILSTWDQAIQKTEKLIEAKEKYFKYLVQKLVTGTGSPKRKKIKLQDALTEISIRNKDNQVDRVLSVTNKNGFVLAQEQFLRRVASINLTNYKMVCRGQYSYNPARINVGSIARLDNWDRGIVSPMYVIFSVDETKVVSDFFLHWLSSHEARMRIRNSTQGSVRQVLRFSDLGSIEMFIPSVIEQNEIVQGLNKCKKEIELLRKIKDKYHLQKKSLMEKLLTGKWQVVVKEG